MTSAQLSAEDSGTYLGATLDDESCLYCGEQELVELHEIWGPREFMLETCCQGMLDAASEFLSSDPREAAQWLDRIGLSAAMRGMPGCGSGLRRVIESDGQLVLDWNLEIRSIPWAQAKAFVREHHRHCPPPAGWRFGAAITNGSDVLGVIVVGRPVARMLDQARIVEVNRLCVRDDLPKGLEWNACSQLYGWAAREAKKRGFERICTYTLASEAGTTLKAAGWQLGGVTVGRSWNSPSRPRVDKMVREDKVRWHRRLVKNPISALWDEPGSGPGVLVANMRPRIHLPRRAVSDRCPKA